MKKPRFGRENPGPTREELEKEAARELERMTRQAGGPPPSGAGSGWSSAPPPPSSPSSFQPRFAGGPPRAPAPPSVRERFEARGQEEEDDEEEGDYSEEEMVTELALRDWSERSGRGRSIEDLALPRLDARAVEAQRDRALREFTERQARMERESEAHRIQRQALGLTPPSHAGSVNLTAARPMGMLNLSSKAAGMRGQGVTNPPAAPAKPAPKTGAKSPSTKKAAKRPTPAATGAAKTGPKKSTAKAAAKPGPKATAPRPATRTAATKKAKTPATTTAKSPADKTGKVATSGASKNVKPAETRAAKARAGKTAKVAGAGVSKKVKPAETKAAKAPAKAKSAPRKESGRR